MLSVAVPESLQLEHTNSKAPEKCCLPFQFKQSSVRWLFFNY